MQLRYVNMEGAGNRILVVDQRAQRTPPPSPEQLRTIGNGDSGLDFDQLMWIVPASSPTSAAGYRVFNNDGSEVEQCGNGVRCVARLLAPESGHAFSLDGPAGVVDVRVHDDGLISVAMGCPTTEQTVLQVGERDYDVTLVAIGNPHCVLRVDDIDSADVAGLGPQIENHERFPDRINVGFMQVIDRSSIRLRVHERGVGETRACGTGACAAVVAGQDLHLLGKDVRVLLPGGQLMVSWRGGRHPVWLAGDAEKLSEGSFDL